jgi:dihydrolipoamide dehydrogenase
VAETSFDVVVVGGGPGGYVAAIRAAQLGLKTAVVEREHLGGICLNWGCIPTKALLRSAEVFRNALHAKDYGLTIQGVEADLPAIVKRSRGVAKQLNTGVGHLLRKNKVTVLDGHGRLLGKGRVAVEKDGTAVAELTARHIILATGARARTFPDLQPDGKTVVTYKGAMTLEEMPRKLLVVGSGAIGIEFASFYRTLGAEVTVVEVLDRIVPVEDAEISAFLEKALTRDGMTILTKAQVKAIDTSGAGAVVTVEQGGDSRRIAVDKVILAVGITPNTEDIGLDNTRVTTDRGFVKTDRWCATDEPGVYAIGDITAPPWLAHKASHEGVLCAERIAGVADVHPLDPRRIPACTYAHPQIASIGLTEDKARAEGLDIKVGRFPFIGNGKAIALGEPEGLIKTIFDAATGELLGAHMIGAEVTELIQGYSIATALETTEADLMHTVFPHPTLSEMMHESVLDAFGRAIHF